MTDAAAGAPQPADRRFRFALSINRLPGTRKDWQGYVEQADNDGYDVVLLGDHIGEERYSSPPAMAVAGGFSKRLRFGTIVFNNDLRHPAMLAKDVATVDVMTEGRYEMGIGAGWMNNDYKNIGLKKDPGPIRIERLGESLQIIKALFGDGPVHFEGKHYTINGLEGWPKPIQRPRPPILVGGGGESIIALGAREADIVSLNPVHRKGTRGGGPELSDEKLAERAGWVRQHAGDRYPQLRIHMLVHSIRVTDNTRAAAEELGAQFSMSAEEALVSPYLFIGSPARICEHIHRLRERYGISYFSIRYQNAAQFKEVLPQISGR
jgi:probable F420-dependent oxidoreductase